MEERNSCDTNISIVLEHSVNDHEQVDGMTFSENKPSIQVKNKKKKKKKLKQKQKHQQQQCDLQNPKENLGLNNQDLLKGDSTDPEKNKSGKSTYQPSGKSSNDAVMQAHDVISNHECKEESGDSDVNVEPVILLPACTTLPLSDASIKPKSALRGSYEELGLGPRPKFHVRWAPGVWEPPCSTVSHTVKSYKVKKKGSRHGGKSRSGQHDSRKQKRKKNKSDSIAIQSGKHKAVNVPPQFVSEASSEILPKDFQEVEISLSSIKPNGYESCEIASNQLPLSLKSGVVDSFQYSNDSTCGLSSINNFGVTWDALALPVGQAII